MPELFDPLAIVVVILRHPRRVNAAAAAIALTVGGVALARTDAHAGSASITVQLPPATPASLFQQASGAAALAIGSSGAAAQLFNADLPFTMAPLAPARPFILTGDDTDRARALLCLTQAVYYEAAGEPEEGQRAVAQVVLNRVRHPAFAKSVCGVVYEGATNGTCQFSFVCNGALDRRPQRGAWRQAETVAREALYGYVDPAVGEATHYHADYVAPVWAPVLAKVAVIGQHIFYRWPGRWGDPAAFTGRYSGEASDPGALHLALSAAVAEGVATQVLAATPHVTYQLAALLDAPAAPVSAPAKEDASAKTPAVAGAGTGATTASK